MGSVVRPGGVTLAPFADFFRDPFHWTVAGNTLRVNDCLITPAGFERVHEAISGLGLRLEVIDTSEFRKMDGGLTCLSLRF